VPPLCDRDGLRLMRRKRRKEKSPEAFLLRGFGNKPGNDLLSHARARAVPSALEGLTSEFGMGSGMAPPTSSPEKLFGGRPAAYGQGTPCLKEREEEVLLLSIARLSTSVCRSCADHAEP
jgi:hypothetical protein